MSENTLAKADGPQRGGSWSSRRDSMKASTINVSRVEFMKHIGFTAGDKLSLIQQIRSGIDVSALDFLADSLSLNTKYFNEVVSISSRTFTRRKKEGKLHADETERVYRVAELLVRAVEVLRDHDQAVQWLKSPQKALGDQRPLDLADTQVGAEEVTDLLGRIEHGVFS